jgi:hypothetical protein
MRMSKEERQLAESYSRLFQHLSLGDLSRARQVSGGMRVHYPDYADNIEKLMKRFRLR